MTPRTPLARKQALLRQALPRAVECGSTTCAVLAGGCPVARRARLADVVEAAWRQSARFDGWRSTTARPPGARPSRGCRRRGGRLPAALPPDARCVGPHRHRVSPPTWRARLTGPPRPGPRRPAGCSRRRPAAGVRPLRAGLRGVARADARASGGSQAGLAGGAIPAAVRPIGGVAVRLRFAKHGRMRFLGHLDLVRHVPRIVRRAGLGHGIQPGHHPKALLSFAPALPLGYEGAAELVELHVEAANGSTKLPARLQAVALEGLTFGPAGGAVRRPQACSGRAQPGPTWSRFPGGWPRNFRRAAAEHLARLRGEGARVSSCSSPPSGRRHPARRTSTTPGPGSCWCTISRARRCAAGGGRAALASEPPPRARAAVVRIGLWTRAADGG